MAQRVHTPNPKAVDTIGVYALAEDAKKINPKNGVAYEVPRGEYPVVGMMTDDGTQVHKAGIVFTSSATNTEKRMDIVEIIRPIDIPAMVQRREISIKSKADQKLAFPLSMFIGEEKDQAQKQSQAAVTDHSMKRGRSV